MGKIRFAVVGSGWRSLFYVRIAQALPERFELTAMLFRREDKAEAFRKEYGVPATCSMEELVQSHPDFVVVAVNKQGIYDMTVECVEKGLAVLTETPPALILEELNRLWRMKQEKHAKILVAEQYFLWPTFLAAKAVVDAGFLGEPDTVMISTAHDYHAVSLIRYFLGAGFAQVSLTGERYAYSIVETGSRAGLSREGALQERERTRVSFQFEGGKRAFYDFSGEQYHSCIRSRHFAVQGPRGELHDDVLLWLDRDNSPRKSVLQVTGGEEVERIVLDGRDFYSNPFPSTTLPQDEVAVAQCLLGMKEYLETGREFYPLADALQDTYLALLMEEAVQSGRQVFSQIQPWARE